MVIRYHYALNRKFRQLSILVFVVMILLSPVIYAQGSRQEAPSLKERLFYGGSFSLQFGTITDIEISPVVGLWVLPRFAVAAGPNYRFYKDPVGRTDIYGGRAYAQFVVIQNLNSIIPLGLNFGFFLHTEDELLSLDSEFWKDPPYTSGRFMVNTYLAGVGMSQPMGRRSSMNLMVLWALNDSTYDLYGTPEIRISFIF